MFSLQLDALRIPYWSKGQSTCESCGKDFCIRQGREIGISVSVRPWTAQWKGNTDTTVIKFDEIKDKVLRLWNVYLFCGDFVYLMMGFDYNDYHKHLQHILLGQTVFVKESGGTVHAFVQILVMISILVHCYFMLKLKLTRFSQF
jgi:hypothetical protein